MDPIARTHGRRVVFAIYATAVVVAGFFGYILGLVVQPNLKAGHVGSLGPVVFELTPLNLAIYGIVMVGLGLGVVLLLVSFASRYDDASTSNSP